MPFMLHIIPEILYQQETTHIVFCSNISPSDVWYITLWGAAYDMHLNKLKVMQKKTVRMMYKTEYNAHTHELFSKLSVLKYEDLYNYEVAKFMCHYTNGNLPRPLCSLFTYSFNVHRYIPWGNGFF